MRAQTIARMVGIASRHGPFRANCLSQSLVLHGLLSWAGIPAEIKFGIPVQAPEQSVKTFTAHAWVEYAGVNLSNSGKIQRYVIFAG